MKISEISTDLVKAKDEPIGSASLVIEEGIRLGNIETVKRSKDDLFQLNYLTVKPKKLAKLYKIYIVERLCYQRWTRKFTTKCVLFKLKFI